jgi:DNA sulfur modification protein DndD
VNLREVTLTNWRSYQTAHFRFPAPTNRKNIILIGAQNGGGKTSLFEAIVLGVFGRDGLPLLPPPKTNRDPEQAEKSTEQRGRGGWNYDRLMEGILNRTAFRAQRMSCGVQLAFEDDDGEALHLHRSWHFRPSGVHKPADEDVRLFEGEARRPDAPPPAVNDEIEWYREEIAARLLPPYLAKFFLFDAEQVRAYAERGMEAQVKNGIEGLLGLPILRRLEDSLQKYAVRKRQEVAAPGDQTAADVYAAIERYELEVKQANDKIEQIEAELPNLRAERHELTERVGSVARNADELKQIAQQEQSSFEEAERLLERLQQMLTGNLALSLAGAQLRSETIEQLEAEAKLETWQAGRTQVDANLDRFILGLTERLKSIAPPLVEPQIEAVAASARESWEYVRFPPPDGCAAQVIHPSLRGRERAQAITRLMNIETTSAAGAAEVVATLIGHRQEGERCRRRRLDLEASNAAQPEDTERLNQLSEEVGSREAALRAERAMLDVARQDLDTARQKLGRIANLQDRGRIPKQQADLAVKVADLTRSLLADAVPTQVGAVAEAMTNAWQRMARKRGMVERIEISTDGAVRLLNARGEDLRERRLSAGEEQIFTQALIWAIAEVSKRDFPFVVDTPLGRLDQDHVTAVLRDFTNRDGQVFLLSTDREVIGENLEAIRDRILQSYLVETRIVDGETLSIVREGYFDDEVA